MILIDDQGEQWDGGSVTLRRDFDSPFSGGEFSDYAVRNLGFIAIDSYGSSCVLRVHPERVADKALVSLLEWLASRRFDRLSAAWFVNGNWNYEICPSVRHCLDKLTALIETARAGKPGEFLSRPMTGAGVKRRSGALIELMQRWQQLNGPDRYRELEGLVRRAVGDRYVFVQQEVDQGRLVFREFGNGLFDHIRSWRVGAVGQPIDEQPDRNYGRWVRDSYIRTLTSGSPSIEDVDVIVNWPHRGRSRLRYKRFIVPLALDSAAPLVLGGSLFDDTIDLRVMPA